jgi:hypothetical protein
MCRQHFENGVKPKRLAAGKDEGLKPRKIVNVTLIRRAGPYRTQGCKLSGCDAAIGDKVGITQSSNDLLLIGIWREAWHSVDRDVKRVEEQPAGRLIGTATASIGKEWSVERI